MSVHPFVARLQVTDLVSRRGRVTRILPTYIEADGPSLPLGSLCAVESKPLAGRPAATSLAEVVGVNRDNVILAPFEESAATFSGALVLACGEADTAPVGDAFLGRAVDALGRPIDDGGPVLAGAYANLSGDLGGPLDRISPRRPLETGVRAIDGLLTLGQGQRVGVFAASGVGKTSLMSQLARDVEADHCVICLVGERGREVEELWVRGLSPEAKARSTLVAATSDNSAAMRVRAGRYALALAEHWRAQGRHVLLLLDSVTRLAMALREIGLAAGEPPTVRAYTPGVFTAIPKLVERCGATKSGGAITAVMTVLSETDDIDDPVSELMKSLLDGHIVLSRSLAERGHFPAIDVPRSISRLAGSLTAATERERCRTAVAMLSAYESSRTLIESGLYAAGANAEIDEALRKRPALLDFLRQGQDQRSDFAATRAGLAAVLAGGAST
jgi:flagellum-specific ATP synthase